MLPRGFFATTALITNVIPKTDEPRWIGGIAFDTALRDRLSLGNFDDRSAASTASDVTLIALVAQRLIDDSLVAWAGHGAGDVAWQMAAINLQALTFTLAASSTTKHAAARERPNGRACRTDPSYDRRCEQQRGGGSFYSGHTSLAFTAAGLTCMHHLKLPLYGGAGDTIACAGATLAAASVGFERILADCHYASDVLVGAAAGALSGFLLPWVSFYAHPQHSDALVSWSVGPLPLPTGGALSLRGIF